MVYIIILCILFLLLGFSIGKTVKCRGKTRRINDYFVLVTQKNKVISLHQSICFRGKYEIRKLIPKKSKMPTYEKLKIINNIVKKYLYDAVEKIDSDTYYHVLTHYKSLIKNAELKELIKIEGCAFVTKRDIREAKEFLGIKDYQMAVSCDKNKAHKHCVFCGEKYLNKAYCRLLLKSKKYYYFLLKKV